jgi:ribosomal protein L11
MTRRETWATPKKEQPMTQTATPTVADRIAETRAQVMAACEEAGLTTQGTRAGAVPVHITVVLSPEQFEVAVAALKGAGLV